MKDATSAILQKDEAVEVLEKMDEELVHEQQTQAKERDAAAQSLRQRLHAKAVELRKARGAGGAPKEPSKVKLDLPHTIDQTTAKTLLPPQAFVWRPK